ncbi:MAG: response regulator transcription factor [Nostocoides sp.]
MVRVLLVEDDATMRASVSAYLRAAGLEVLESGDGAEGAQLALTEPIDVALLDVMLPSVTGVEICRRIRQARPQLPVIMVTAKGEEHDRVRGLQVGADDYVTKPFSLRELDLRIRGLLRRVRADERAPYAVPGVGRAVPAGSGGAASATAAQVLVDGTLRVDLAASSATLDGQPLTLTNREYDLLVHLLKHPGTVFSRDELMRSVWGWEIGDQSTVTVHVRRLREKVEAQPSRPVRVVTVFGKGYRWDPQP